MKNSTTGRVRVAIVRTAPERIIEDYRRVLELSGCAEVLRGADHVVAYGNLTWSKFFPAASSPPWQLDGVASAVAVETKTAWRWVTGTGHTGRPRRGARAYRWPEALKGHGQSFEPVSRDDRLPYPSDIHLMAVDRIVPEGLPVPPSFTGSVALQLPTLKTHGQLVLAGALENAWCTWLPAGGGLATTHPHEVVVDLLRLQQATHRSICAVMDGTVAGGGAGPRTVEPMQANVLLASTDPVALDAVASRLAGIDPFSVRYLALAYALGLGCADPDEIDLVGDNVEGIQLHLRARRPPAALARATLEQIKLGGLERTIFQHRRWLALASTLYYDVLWYRLVGRARLAAFRRSPWGVLFASYGG